MSRHDPDTERDEEDERESSPPAQAVETSDGRFEWLEYAKYVLPIVGLAAAAIAGWLQGPPATLLVLCGCALATAIWLFWASLRTLLGETPLSGADAYALGAPRAEEEKKRAVLRTLKDLEFEHSVGKINDAEFVAQTARYRAEAKRLLRVIEDQAENNPQRAKVEALVAQRLAAEGLGPAAGTPKNKRIATPATVPSKAPEVAKVSTTTESVTETVCAKCGTQNDADAVFCKKCGDRRADAEAATDEGKSKIETSKESS